MRLNGTDEVVSLALVEKSEEVEEIEPDETVVIEPASAQAADEA